MATTADIPTITVDVDSRYGWDSETPGTDEHDVTVRIGGTAVFSRTYSEPADRHHGDYDWNPTKHFGEIGLSEFGHTLSRMIDAFENGHR